MTTYRLYRAANIYDDGPETSTPVAIIEAPDDERARRIAQRTLRTRGKWTYTGDDIVSGWNLDHPRVGARTRIAWLERVVAGAERRGA